MSKSTIQLLVFAAAVLVVALFTAGFFLGSLLL